MHPKTVGWLKWLGQVIPARLVCAVRKGGHEYTWKNEPGRKYLACYHCGHESPGWDIESGRRIWIRMVRPERKKPAPPQTDIE